MATRTRIAYLCAQDGKIYLGRAAVCKLKAQALLRGLGTVDPIGLVLKLGPYMRPEWVWPRSAAANAIQLHKLLQKHVSGEVVVFKSPKGPGDNIFTEWLRRKILEGWSMAK